MRELLKSTALFAAMAIALPAAAQEADSVKSGSFIFTEWNGPAIEVHYAEPSNAAPDAPIIIVMHGATRKPASYRDGWKGEGQISYAGANCVARAELAAELVHERLTNSNTAILDKRYDLIGQDSVPRADMPAQKAPVPEVRMRFAARCETFADAERVAEEVESLYLCGPAGGGGVTRNITKIIAIASTLIPSQDVSTNFEMLERQDAVA